jgi:hypothetical protein
VVKIKGDNMTSNLEFEYFKKTIMKRKTIIKSIIYTICLIVIIISCRKEMADKADKLDPMKPEILEAQKWFETRYSADIQINSSTLSKGTLQAKPDWDHAFVNQNKNSKSVEMPIIINNGSSFGIATMENLLAYNENGDIRFMLSETRLVIEKRGNRTFAFLMTIIPDRDYRVSHHFDAFKSTYTKWQDGFNGLILYFNLDGNFSNGWMLKEGKNVQTINKKKGKNLNYQMSQLSKGCTAYYLQNWVSNCHLSFFNGELYDTDCGPLILQQEDLMFTLCDEESNNTGGSNDEDSGYIPGLPCIGDPLTEIHIAPFGINQDISTGYFGCMRPVLETDCFDGTTWKKYHNGIDYSCDENTPVYSIKGGVVAGMCNTVPYGTRGTGDKLGNYVIVTYNEGGSTISVIYGHLNDVIVSIGDKIYANTLIGSSGKTGNAYDMPYPHLHLGVSVNGCFENPINYVSTKMNMFGTIIATDCF